MLANLKKTAEPKINTEIIEIKPMQTSCNSVIDLPGSKSITNRVLLLAAVADGISFFRNFLLCDDTEAMLEGLKALGIKFELNILQKEIRVWGCNGKFPNLNAEIFTRDSGTMTRFLIPMLAAQKEGVFKVSASERMSQRPLRELLISLESLGAQFEYLNQTYSMPLVIHARGLGSGEISIFTSESTQFLSGLLMASALAKGPISIKPIKSVDSHNESYVKMTVRIAKEFGGKISGINPKGAVRKDEKLEKNSNLLNLLNPLNPLNSKPSHSQIDSTQYHSNPARYKSLPDFAIEPDLSTASYFFAAAALTGGEVEVLNIPNEPLQGDIQFLEILDLMGAEVIRKPTSIIVKGLKNNQKLKGIPFINMRHCSDTFMTLAAIASFADSPTEIRGVAHTRLQESDRIEAISEGLKILGARVETFEDGLKIYPQALHGAIVSSFDDHRVAMSLALIGLKIPGVKISEFSCVKKTCPNFFEILNSMMI